MPGNTSTPRIEPIRLTLVGDAYAREIREALRKIAAASLALRANPAGGTLALACLPTWGARWLVPRLPQFLAAVPGVLEVSIGHALIADALEHGLAQTVRDYLAAIARGGAA